MRLVVDYNNPDVLYFASQRGGLLRTSDGGMTWQSISIAAGSRANELNCTFVWVHPDSGTLVLGTAGINNKSSDGLTRGHSLYVSYDTGGTWEELPMPDCLVPDGARMKGSLPNVTITMAVTCMSHYHATVRKARLMTRDTAVIPVMPQAVKYSAIRLIYPDISVHMMISHHAAVHIPIAATEPMSADSAEYAHHLRFRGC